jgi:ribosomal protein S18 acetylase RimI-like enzyme
MLVGTLLAVTCQMLFGQCRSFMVVEDVVIDANYRRRGIGKALIQQVEKFAKSKNCSYIMLITDVDRLDSREFYKSLGYKSAEYCAFKKHLNLNEQAERGSRQKIDRALNKVKNIAADKGDQL